MRISDWSSDVCSSDLLGVAAARLDSSTPTAERRQIWSQINGGALDLLYLSPEGLMAGGMLDMLRGVKIALIAIDEAHCVSQWGHDFRPEYRSLGRLADAFPGVPRIAVTATADVRTRDDIRGELHLHDAAERSEEHTSELQSLMRISY